MSAPQELKTTSNAALQRVRQREDVALHEGGARREADFVGQGARRRDALAREVDAR